MFERFNIFKKEETGPQEREAFSQFDQFYESSMSRGEGEKILSSIASDAKREYVWAFDEERSLWIYFPSKSSEDIDVSRGHSRHEITIPKELLKPPGASSDVYHIHPDILVDVLVKNRKPGWHSEEFLRVSNQMPKEDDLHAASVLINNGYKTFKVVTSLGVTTLKFFSEKLDPKQERHDIEGVTINQEMIYGALKEGVNPAIRKVFEELNRHYGGVFVYEFHPLSEDSE